MRIALVAMSGIRVCDPELLQLGLTLPGFVERGKAIASLPSLGLLTLAGLTPTQHEVHYIEIADLAHAEDLTGPFDLVAISSFSAQIGEAYALAARLTAAGTPVVMGGPHVSVLPEEAQARGAAVVIGHGELHWLDVLTDVENRRLKPSYGSLEDDYDLAQSPLPAYGLLDLPRYNRLMLQTSRGCPHRCHFCAGSSLYAHRYRQKPAALVLRDLDAILRLWRHPFIEFADDNSFINRPYWLDLLPEIGMRGVRWFTETDISVGADDDLLEALRRAGCAELLIGLESPRPDQLEGVETRTDWKRLTAPRYGELLRNIQAHGIRVNGCFILGLDAQGPEVFDEIRDFVAREDLFDVQVTLQTAFPGTPLHARLDEEGRLTHPGQWERCTLFDVTFVPRHMTVAQLEAGLRSLIVDLYSAEATAARRERFNRRLRDRRLVEKDVAV